MIGDWINKPMYKERTELTNDQLFDAMRTAGIVKARVFFSGGNDEGGCDRVELVDERGKEYESGGKVLPLFDGFVETLETLPHRKYGSFAGDFYVNGVITVDVKTRTVKMNGEEEVRHSETMEEEDL